MSPRDIEMLHKARLITKERADSLSYDLSPWRSWAKTLTQLIFVVWAYWGFVVWIIGRVSVPFQRIGMAIIVLSCLTLVVDFIGRMRREPKP